jgi:predicted nucleic acid-binding Zn ribbon protein
MSTPLQGLEDTIIQKRREGQSVSSIAAEYKVSRQGVYYLLNREGVDTSRKEKPPATRECVVCKKITATQNKTCSKKCAGKLIGLAKRKYDAKFTKFKVLELTCHKCGKKFTRTQHQQSVSLKGKEKQRNFCSLECYRNRNK